MENLKKDKDGRAKSALTRLLCGLLIIFAAISCNDDKETEKYYYGKVVKVYYANGGFMSYDGPISYIKFEDGEVREYKHFFGEKETKVKCDEWGGGKPFHSTFCKAI